MIITVKDYDAVYGAAQVHSVKRAQGARRELLCASCASYIPKTFPTLIDGTGRECDVCQTKFEEAY